MFRTAGPAQAPLQGPGARSAGLDGYLSLKFTPPGRTLLLGVNKLGPGQVLEMEAGPAPRVRRYWSPLGRRGPATRAEAVEKIEELLLRAVRRRLVSDVPVCLFLSGGLDSSLIASALAETGAKDMTAYTIGYDDLPGYSEFEYAREAARAFPVRLRELVLSSREALETLEDPSLALDEPVADWVWVPLHHLSRQAHRDGYKVVLVGEGSDELFFGYDSMEKGLQDLRRMSKPLPGPWPGGLPAFGPGLPNGAAGAPALRSHAAGGRGEPVYMGSRPAGRVPNAAKSPGPGSSRAGTLRGSDFVPASTELFREAVDPGTKAISSAMSSFSPR